MRTLKEWMKDTKEFMKDHVGMEVNLSEKHKKIFETVNETNEWLEGLDDLRGKEAEHLGEKLVKDILKGEEKKDWHCRWETQACQHTWHM